MRNQQGAPNTFVLAAMDMQGFWLQPKHDIGPAMSHGSQALYPHVTLCNLWQEFKEEAGTITVKRGGVKDFFGLKASWRWRGGGGEGGRKKKITLKKKK